MQQNSNTRSLALLIYLVGIALAVKLIWIVIALAYFPAVGVEHIQPQAKKSLYYRYKLASDTVLSPETDKPRHSALSIKSLRLVGIYSSGTEGVIALMKGTKSYVLAVGELIEGYRLTKVGGEEADFEKDGKIYTLKLYSKKKEAGSSITPAKRVEGIGLQKSESQKIIDHGERKVVPRTLVSRHVSTPDMIWKNIGLNSVKKGGKIVGFKVRFVRGGSVFQKLGLKRGDVIKAVNGEELTDEATGMELLKNIGTIDSLTLTIMRGKEEKEYEYEIR